MVATLPKLWKSRFATKVAKVRFSKLRQRRGQARGGGYRRRGIEPRSPVNANQCFVFQVESESRIVLMLPDSAQSLCGVERVPYFTAGRWQQQSAERGHHESSVGEHRRHDRRPSEKGNHCWPGQQRTRRKRLRFRSFAALQVLMLSCVVFIWPVALAGAKVAGVDWSMSPTPIFKQHQVGTGSVCT